MEQVDMVKLNSIFSLQNNILSRLEQAYQHAQFYQQLNESVFPYQEFALSMNDLFDIALGKSLLSHNHDKVERCFEHMLFHKQENHTFWSYQPFAFTLFEILEACMRKVNPAAILEIKQDMRNFHKEYEDLAYSYKKSLTESVDNNLKNLAT